MPQRGSLHKRARSVVKRGLLGTAGCCLIICREATIGAAVGGDGTVYLLKLLNNLSDYVSCSSYLFRGATDGHFLRAAGQC